ncbi:dTMP kinase [Thauera propionica]|uniref:Thymidylate kinase n=1 Tax=Thauera propionica TaxID=2019431 RepID=A0A235F0D3_9RHOO|nr:dTMP kinase [Thauera propionica]OYD54724.1 dTMP kinase [Thauera propionica]
MPNHASAAGTGKTLPRGRFITFEGIDGAGKSSQIAAVVALLRVRGIDVEQSREPGGTPLGERLRELLLHEPMHLETEAMLMFAARREHLAARIEPALAEGRWVVCDRFSDATFAYQVGGRGLARGKFDALEAWVHPGLQPDLTLLFDLAPDIAAGRVASTGVDPDRFEREQRDFFERVRGAYLERARQAPQRIRVIDANRPPEVIRAEIERIVTETLFA